MVATSFGRTCSRPEALHGAAAGYTRYFAADVDADLEAARARRAGVAHGCTDSTGKRHLRVDGLGPVVHGSGTADDELGWDGLREHRRSTTTIRREGESRAYVEAAHPITPLIAHHNTLLSIIGWVVAREHSVEALALLLRGSHKGSPLGPSPVTNCRCRPKRFVPWRRG